MNKIEQTIQEFEKIRTQINNAKFEDYQVNREIFDNLKTKLIENGFDFEVISIDSNNKFFTPAQEFEKFYGFDMNERFKDAKGKLASISTKAIRDLNSAVQKRMNKPKVETIIKTEKIYPKTSWKLLRNGLFWTILLGLVSLLSVGFYNLGQNSKEKENAELVNSVAEKKVELKELTKQLIKKNNQIEIYKEENLKLEKEINEKK